jgi:hypothetical protein
MFSAFRSMIADLEDAEQKRPGAVLLALDMRVLDFF